MRLLAPCALLSTTAVAFRMAGRAAEPRFGTVRMLSTPPSDAALLKFSELPISAALKKSVAAMGLTTATPVQTASMPPLLAGKDVVAKARTGTGKTVAFLLPTLQRLGTTERAGKGQIRALVLSPTRELAAQIAEAAASLTEGGPLRTACIFGGTSMAKDRRQLSGEIDLLVATPGRLWDHIENEGLRARLGSLQTLILDEGDRLLDAGFAKSIGDIVAALPRERQSLCFSATMPPSLAKVLQRTLRPGHETIDCVGQAADSETASRVEQEYMSADMNALPALAAAVVRREIAAAQGSGKVVVFCPTANQAQFVSELFVEMGIANSALHSRKSQALYCSLSTAHCLLLTIYC